MLLFLFSSFFFFDADQRILRQRRNIRRVFSRFKWFFLGFDSSFRDLVSSSLRLSVGTAQRAKNLDFGNVERADSTAEYIQLSKKFLSFHKAYE